LQQGVVDGQENPIATIYSMRYYEVQKFVSLDGHTYESVAVLINPNFFNKLSEKHKEIVVKAAAKARDQQRAKLERLDAERIEVIKKAGVTIEENPDVAAFKEATKDFGKILDMVPAEMIQKFKDAAEAAK
jgi:TRAP-type C4-dicarboxylate transport system substrate-binding protein